MIAEGMRLKYAAPQRSWEKGTRVDPRPQNYCSFYVKEPFIEYRINATSTPDYCYYNQLKVWRRCDRSFNYYDAHCLTYNLRDGRPFEEVKQIIHERIDRSKNIILILTSNTKESDIMNEELEYGINVKGLPLVVVYPEFTIDEIIDADKKVSERMRKLWIASPTLYNDFKKVFVQHTIFDKQLIHEAIERIDIWQTQHTTCFSSEI